MFSGVVIVLVMRAVHGGGAGGLGSSAQRSSGAGQGRHKDALRTLQIVPRDLIKLYHISFGLGRRCNHIWICDSRALGVLLSNVRFRGPCAAVSGASVFDFHAFYSHVPGRAEDGVLLCSPVRPRAGVPYVSNTLRWRTYRAVRVADGCSRRAVRTGCT